MIAAGASRISTAQILIDRYTRKLIDIKYFPLEMLQKNVFDIFHEKKLDVLRFKNAFKNKLELIISATDNNLPWR